MRKAVLDDHLLRDLLADDISADLRRRLKTHEPATTNLYLVRLCRSVVSARGGALTGSWDADQRRALGARLTMLPQAIEVVPMRDLSYRMAELAVEHRLSTLGAEAAAAAEHLHGDLLVWEGDDGPVIRAAARAVGCGYRTIHR